MSITSGPVNEAEMAAEKLAAKIEADAPAMLSTTVRAILDVLAEYDLEVVLSLRKRS